MTELPFPASLTLNYSSCHALRRPQAEPRLPAAFASASVPCPGVPRGPGTGGFGRLRAGAGAALCGTGPAGAGLGARSGGSGEAVITRIEGSGTPWLGFSGDSCGSDSSPPALLCSSPQLCFPHSGNVHPDISSPSAPLPRDVSPPTRPQRSGSHLSPRPGPAKDSELLD